MIKFIITIESDFRKVLIHELSREQLLGACRMEDTQQTTKQEKNELLKSLELFFRDIPFICNGNIFTKDTALFAGFSLITSSQLVRKWVEGCQDDFGITLALNLETQTYQIWCSSIEDWMDINGLVKFSIDN